MSKERRNRKYRLVFAAVLVSLGVTGTAQAGEPVLREILAPTDMISVGDGYLVTDSYNRVVWKITEDENQIIAGAVATEDLYGQPMGGYVDSENSGSYFKKPWAIAPFLDGYAVSDPDNHVIRFINDKTTKTVNEKQDGEWKIGETWGRPMGLAAGDDGCLYVSDAEKGTITKVTKDGNVSLLIENLYEPTGLCWKNGALYIAETGNSRILKYQDGAWEVAAGTGIGGMTDGSLDQAKLACPQGIEVSDDGILFIADTGNNAVRMVSGEQMTTLLATDSQTLQQYPAEPLGMLWEEDTLYVCDAFARKIYCVEYQ